MLTYFAPPSRIKPSSQDGLSHPSLDSSVPDAGLALDDLIVAPYRASNGWAKRAMDVGLSFLLLLGLCPLFLLVGVAVLLESRSPVLFRQLRFGVGGRPFELLKFRSMRADIGDATGELRTAARDHRVTPLGRILRRTSIDELPQLVNVLRGEMSLVGPRPHPLMMKVDGRLYADAVPSYHLRHRVRPGITGWAQINGSRGEVSDVAKAKERVRLDIWYIENCSVPLDILILLRTACGGFCNFYAD
jgi:polysaccharide biosynthesis protein PslA